AVTLVLAVSISAALGALRKSEPPSASTSKASTSHATARPGEAAGAHSGKGSHSAPVSFSTVVQQRSRQLAAARTLGEALAPGGQTVVSLEFDDENSDQYQAGAMLAAHGMRGTFFVNSGRIGNDGYMTVQQLQALQSGGNEIGGHTIYHVDLPTLSSDA